jgi:type IV secretory pathway TrbL component
MSNESMKSFENTIRNTAEDVRDRTANLASEVKDRTANLASEVKDRTVNMASKVKTTLEDQRENAAAGLKGASSKVHNIANSMGTAAEYLHESDLNKVGKDALNICRRYPVQSVLAALAVGFLIGRTRHN